MKKLSILTGLLALAACGGGSGGGGGNGSLDPRASNAVITGMVSEIGVCEAGSTSCSKGSHANLNLSRSPTALHVNIGGELYTTYRLDDVDFGLAMESNDLTLKFSVNGDGKINGVVIETPGEADANFARVGDTKRFAGDVEENDGHTQHFDFTMNSYGQQVGLQYSDFGVFTPTGQGGAAGMSFAGGYDVKKIDPSAIQAEATFTGKAVGNVFHKEQDQNDGKSLDLVDNNAQLVFNPANGGTQTLTANFANWYDVSVSQVGASDATIAFTNYQNADNNFKFTNESSTLANRSCDGNNACGVFDARYYGDVPNNAPSEATALIQYRETQSNDDIGTRMNLSFGGTN